MASIVIETKTVPVILAAMKHLYANWLLPDWPAPRNVHAVCTTRNGGYSKTPFDTMNLGDHVGDDPADVARNRSKLQQTIRASPIFLSQIHGVEVAPLSLATPHGTPADACLTRQPGVACTIMVADCLPVLFTNVQGTVIAAAHAGWRGLAAGVLEASLKSMYQGNQPLVPSRTAQIAIEMVANEPAWKLRADTLVWLGPCIGAAAFEVGAEMLATFVAHDPLAAQYFKPTSVPGKYRADLAGLARQRLVAAGVAPSRIYGNDSSPGWCTASNPAQFFSHRRDGVALGGSGRMAACIWLG